MANAERIRLRGTVRKDYSEFGNAWEHFPHDHARSRDLILFYEYFHGDTGAVIGASHQTGWTGLVANQLQMYAHLPAQKTLAAGRAATAQSAAGLYPAERA